MFFSNYNWIEILLFKPNIYFSFVSSRELYNIVFNLKYISQYENNNLQSFYLKRSEVLQSALPRFLVYIECFDDYTVTFCPNADPIIQFTWTN